jgi:hypothetical protein
VEWILKNSKDLLREYNRGPSPHAITLI